MRTDDTIVAPATGAGGAIALARMSGGSAIGICDRIFRPISGKPLSDSAGFRIHYGRIMDGERTLDDVLVSVFRAPHSYTGEDMVEISCHGSAYIEKRILELLVEHGARTAEAGEFTVRAFLAGKMDLSQAEAVADTIAASDRAAHSLASTQMRGGYSAELGDLRAELLRMASLLELELDFGEEDVEFADRAQLTDIVGRSLAKTESMLGSFKLGNAIKEGVPVVIVGAPNVGKSTLLNALLKEERAMVSEIAGTTRDTVEESINIGGVRYRFIDTAGLRESDDRLENMGIERSIAAIARARLILYVTEYGPQNSPGDDFAPNPCSYLQGAGELNLREDQRVCVVVNKMDRAAGWGSRGTDAQESINKGCDASGIPVIGISAREGRGIQRLIGWLKEAVESERVFEGETVVSNSRHYEALLRARQALIRVKKSLLPAGKEVIHSREANIVNDNDKAQEEDFIARSLPVNNNTAAIQAESHSSYSSPNDGSGCLSEFRPSGLPDPGLTSDDGSVDTQSEANGFGLPCDDGSADPQSRSSDFGLPCDDGSAGLQVVSGSSGLPADIISLDLREALYHIGTITGEITTDEILASIFSKFCIGK